MRRAPPPRRGAGRASVAEPGPLRSVTFPGIGEIAVRVAAPSAEQDDAIACGIVGQLAHPATRGSDLGQPPPLYAVPAPGVTDEAAAPAPAEEHDHAAPGIVGCA